MSKDLVKLSTLIDEISMGPFGSDIKVDNFVDEGVPVLNGANLTGYKLVENEFRYVTLEKAKSFKKAIAKRGDIVITHRGTLGQISYIPEDSKFDEYVISQSQFRVAFKKELIDTKFLVYYFHTNEGQRRLLANKCHVGVPALAQATTNFKLIEIPLPKLSTQNQIAAVLSALDAKIELNNRINAQLEALAKTLYDYWFVQFDFPYSPPLEGCLQDGVVNGKPYKSSGGKMVYNEELKREIPEGWEVKKLEELSELLVRGIAPIYTENKGILVLNQKCIRNKSIDYFFSRRHDHETKSASTKLLKSGDILVNSTGVGTLGRLAIVKRLKEEFVTVDSHVTIVRIDEAKESQLFIGYSLTERQFDIEKLGEGSTGQTELSRNNLGKLELIVPTLELQKSFERFIKPQLQKIANNEAENEQLAQLRDWLLPMLMNGQVTVNTNATVLNMAAEDAVGYRK